MEGTVLIVENRNTSKVNSDPRDVGKEQRKIMKEFKDRLWSKEK